MRYAHAKPYKRARRQLRTLKTYLGRTIRGIRRQIDGDKELEDAFRAELWKARRVMTQRPRDDVPKKIYSLHAPKGGIGKGKSHKPYEFGVKASAATTLGRSKGGQFAVHARRCPALRWTYAKDGAAQDRGAHRRACETHPGGCGLQGP